MFTKTKKYEEAFSQLKKYNNLKDSIMGIEQKKVIENLTIKYKVQQKDDKIKILKQQREIVKRRNLLFIVASILVILGLLVLVYIVNLKRKNNTLLIKEMQRDISDYIHKIHDFEEEIHEQHVSKHDLFLEKIKQFDLTEREEEVLLYISKGYKNAEIAEKIFVSVNTVKTHIKNIFVKMDVRNRIEATNKAKV